jgi:hypothetical protein
VEGDILPDDNMIRDPITLELAIPNTLQLNGSDEDLAADEHRWVDDPLLMRPDVGPAPARTHGAILTVVIICSNIAKF